MNITQCSQSKTAFQTVTSEGASRPDITTFGFVTDYIHTYIDTYIHTGVTETTYFASE